MTLLILSFVAGLLTVLAPCILPLLPVIVGGSLDNTGGGTSMRRAFTVTGSLALSVILFTFLLKASTLFIAVPESFWKYLSGGIVIGFGLISLFPTLWEKVSVAATLNQRSNALLGAGYQKKSFWGDVIVGGALGPVFSTCSPTYFVVLATVLPVSPVLGFTYILAYTLGLSLALLVIAFVGQKIMGRLGVAADPHGKFKRTLGLIFLIVGIAIISGYDKKLERAVLDSGIFDITTVEQRLLKLNEKPALPSAKPGDGIPDSVDEEVLPAEVPATTTTAGSVVTPPAATKPTTPADILTAKKAKYHRSPEITGADGYLNTNDLPVTIAQYRGKKVVLIDFWTYSCINCQRTLPYVTGWYKQYEDKGLVIIGVHTPEFAFEHVKANVEEATKRFGVTYPVVLDNHYETWTAFGNQYWPRKYLIDIDGFVVYDHIGEGAYAETEANIKVLLKERADRLGEKVNIDGTLTTIENAAGGASAKSPETYLGAYRNDLLGNGTPKQTGEQNLSEPITVKDNTLYLIGKWNITNEFSETSPDVGSGTVGSDRIDYLYNAAGLYMVLGAKQGTVTVEVTVDGKSIDTAMRGADVFEKDGRTYVTVGENRLYRIIDAKAAGKHLFEMIIGSPGLQAYTFTFG